MTLGEKKINCRTGESNLRQQRAGPMLYQLSYIRSESAMEPIRKLCSVITLCGSIRESVMSGAVEWPVATSRLQICLP